MIERSLVSWGTTEIPYEIRRSARRATVSLAIEPEGGLFVTAPAATPITKLDHVVRSKARWITQHLAQRVRAPEPAAREFVSGETCLYLGRQYRLAVVQSEQVGPIQLRAGRLHLAIPSALPKGREPAYTRAALVDWYRRRAREHLPPWLRSFAARLGVHHVAVLVADQAKRWGSCSGRTVRLNWRVMQAPKRVIEYVLAHEAVHLVHEHHGPAFWAMLGRLMPDYEVRKARLREMGAGLVW
ncbi:MAG: M48 family metallopeptidase [Myxococcales bacterium]|nr:M48 family metallopeptidase [Myxococcales bacterium]